MSDPRDALLDKFRASLRARVQKIRDMLGILKEIPDNTDAAAQVLGELHTLKGETRLLGLAHHSELAHALETLLGRIDVETIAQADAALEAMGRALMDQCAREHADALIDSASRRLSGEHGKSDIASEIQTAESTRDERERRDGADDIVVPAALGASERWVQVDANLIEGLCDTMATISGDFGRIFAKVAQLVAATGSMRGNARSQGSLLLEECTRFRVALDDSTVRTWGLRMVPVQPLLRELSDHARKLAVAAGKQVKVTVDAGGVHIERDALDKVWDAMIHLVRNSVDHGIENAEVRGSKGPTGNIKISARTIGTSVTLTVSDDGQGIDVDRVRQTAITRQLLDPKRAQAMTDDEVVQLVFEHGFSTRDKVSATSGRGVGLDVVKARAESLGGRVEVLTQKGSGTRFAITLPFTLSKEQLIVFELAGGVFGLQRGRFIR